MIIQKPFYFSLTRHIVFRERLTLLINYILSLKMSKKTRSIHMSRFKMAWGKEDIKSPGQAFLQRGSEYFSV
jgi:hypothetical protein